MFDACVGVGGKACGAVRESAAGEYTGGGEESGNGGARRRRGLSRGRRSRQAGIDGCVHKQRPARRRQGMGVGWADGKDREAGY
jgi:hypothetical protein